MSTHIQQVVPTFAPRDDLGSPGFGMSDSGRIYQARSTSAPVLSHWARRVTALRLSVGLNVALVVMLVGALRPFG